MLYLWECKYDYNRNYFDNNWFWDGFDYFYGFVARINEYHSTTADMDFCSGWNYWCCIGIF